MREVYPKLAQRAGNCNRPMAISQKLMPGPLSRGPPINGSVVASMVFCMRHEFATGTEIGLYPKQVKSG